MEAVEKEEVMGVMEVMEMMEMCVQGNEKSIF